MRTYQTAQIAAHIGVHPNTIRFYEAQGLLPPVARKKNGYRVYTQSHLLQLRLIRLAFRAEILSANLRGMAVDIVKASAGRAFAVAEERLALYQAHLRGEMQSAREAIALAGQLAEGRKATGTTEAIGRQAAAGQIGVSVDVLRDWERNGLLTVPRKGNQRQYGAYEMSVLKIIAVLRNANYSQMAIRRMLEKLKSGQTDLLSSIDTPEPSEDIVSVADRYITSLEGALRDADEMLPLLKKIQAQA